MREFTLPIVCILVILLIMGAAIFGPADSRVSPPRVVGRFQAITPNTALDTTTGELCWSYDPIGGNGKIRACKDIK